MFETGFVSILAALVILFGIVAWRFSVHVNKRLWRAQQAIEDLQQQFELTRQSISGLTAGAVGMDRRLDRLETREKALCERQESLENQQGDEQPYGHAIRLVQQGAAVQRLVQELDLSENEAELIVRLHGQRDSA